MDPVSAAGFASSIITFIDFSYKVIQGSLSLYQSAAGATDDNIRISSIVGDLKKVTEAITQPAGSQRDGPHWRELSKLALECHAVSKELTGILESLERKEGNKAWRSFEAGWKSMRKSKEIAALEQRLNFYRVQLVLRLSIILNENQTSVQSQLDEMRKGDVKYFDRTIAELGSVQQAMGKLNARLMAEADHSISMSADADGSHGALDELRAELSAVIETLQAIPKRAPADLHVLNRLHFGTLYSRVDRITDAEFGTFTWLLNEEYNVSGDSDGDGDDDDVGDIRMSEGDEDDSEGDEDDSEGDDGGQNCARDNGEMRDATYTCPTCGADRIARQFIHEMFTRWLRSENGVFHFSGKAGAGKSTLMKLVCQDQSLIDKLNVWAGKKKLVFASFFFWNSGDESQRSLEGLYRSLLFETLRQCPELTKTAFPDFWATTNDSYVEGAAWARSPFRLPELRLAMKNLIEGPSGPRTHRFCFFIDGLDEFEGDSTDHEELARQLRQWADSADVKICASSRPEQGFLDVFDEDKRVNLHELTRPDIRQFVNRMLARPPIDYLDATFINSIACSIQEDAEGVFLWARLVVRSIQEGIRHRFTREALLNRLDNTPKDLESLFRKKFESIDACDQERAYRMLSYVADHGQVNSLHFSWLDDLSDPDFPFKEPIRAYSDEQALARRYSVDAQLKTFCKSLLEIQTFEYELQHGIPYFDFHVGFFHRTVRDFLQRSDIKLVIKQRLGDGFNTMAAKGRLDLAEVKFAPFDKSNPDLIHDRIMEALTDCTQGWLRPPLEERKLLEEYTAIINHYRQNGHVVTGCLERPDNRAWVWSVSEPCSFLHFLAYYGYSDYVVDQVKQGQSGQLDGNGLCLLYSACAGYGGPGFVGRLIAAGVTFTGEVRRLSHRSAPGWVGFLYRLADGCLDGGGGIGSMRHGKLITIFLILEKLLATKPELNIRWELEDITPGNHTTRPAARVSMILEDMIMWFKPPNMDVLMREILRQKCWGGWNLRRILWSWMTPSITRVEGDVLDRSEGFVRPVGDGSHKYLVSRIFLGNDCAWDFAGEDAFRIF